MALLRQCAHRAVVALSLLWAVPGGAEESKAGHPGYCAIGGEEIAARDETGRLTRLPTYREIYCTYTNGQTARVALCDHHALRHDETDYPTIWASIRRGWTNDMEMTRWPKARREKYWAFYEGVTIQTCDE